MDFLYIGDESFEICAYIIDVTIWIMTRMANMAIQMILLVRCCILIRWSPEIPLSFQCRWRYVFEIFTKEVRINVMYKILRMMRVKSESIPSVPPPLAFSSRSVTPIITGTHQRAKFHHARKSCSFAQ